MAKIIRYWLGSTGPFIFRPKPGEETPFRIQQMSDRIRPSTTVQNVAFNVKGGKSLRVTLLDPLSVTSYSAYRAAHFYSFQQGVPL